MWLKLILFIHVYDIIPYINCALCFVQVRTGCYSNLFFFFVVIAGQYVGNWSSGLILRYLKDKLVISQAMDILV